MGGGKSYFTAETALKAWKEGAIVHSNMDWNEERLAELGYDKLHVRLPDDPTKWLGVIKGGAEGLENLLIVDESAMIFHTWDAAESKKRDRDLFDVLVMSRKLGLDCYFISQHADNVQSAIRRIAQHDLRCVAVSKIPIIGPTMARIKGDFLRVVRQPENRKELSRTYHRFSKEVGGIYHTEAVRGVATTIQREATRTKPQKPKTPVWLKFSTGIVILSIVLGLWSTKRNWDRMYANDKEPKPDAVAEAKAGKEKSGTLADKFGSAITPTVEQELHPPALHPFGEPSGIKMKQVEWDEQDERIITCIRREKGTTIVHTLGGQTWRPGANVDGGWVMDMLPYAGAFFAISDTGRVYYLRPRTYRERRAYDEYVVQRAAMNERNKQQWNTQSTPPPSSLAGQ
ncbi:MAG TPA: zonular occludens toxin domain-containing protein [Prosthecobacter sp.]